MQVKVKLFVQWNKTSISFMNSPFNPKKNSEMEQKGFYCISTKIFFCRERVIWSQKLCWAKALKLDDVQSPSYL